MRPRRSTALPEDVYFTAFRSGLECRLNEPDIEQDLLVTLNRRPNLDSFGLGFGDGAELGRREEGSERRRLFAQLDTEATRATWSV